jgi:hypothetical protein
MTGWSTHARTDSPRDPTPCSYTVYHIIIIIIRIHIINCTYDFDCLILYYICVLTAKCCGRVTGNCKRACEQVSTQTPIYIYLYITHIQILYTTRVGITVILCLLWFIHIYTRVHRTVLYLPRYIYIYI